jgi:hypothetical protein
MEPVVNDWRLMDCTLAETQQKPAANPANSTMREFPLKGTPDWQNIFTPPKWRDWCFERECRDEHGSYSVLTTTNLATPKRVLTFNIS